MSGLLTGLVERTLGLVPVLEPRPRSRFEPVAEDGFEGVVPEPGDGLPPRPAGARQDARPPDAGSAPVPAPRREQRAERPVPGRPEPIAPAREAPAADAPTPVGDVTPRQQEQAFRATAQPAPAPGPDGELPATAQQTEHQPDPGKSVRPSPPKQAVAYPQPTPRPDGQRPATARQTAHRPSPEQPVRPSPPVRAAVDRDVPEEPPAAMGGRPRGPFAHRSTGSTGSTRSTAAETAPRSEPAATGPVREPSTASGVPRGEHGPLIAGRKDGGADAPPPAGVTRPVSRPMSPPGEPAGPPPDPAAVVRAALRQALAAPRAVAGGAGDPERATAAPRITVNIGRVELRTAARPAPSGTARPAGTGPRQDPADGARPLSLADYLAGRDQGSGA
ncbi:hypothetical protein ACFXDH_13905 [Streptomyces sp. NPDC059467]|uniref:hypothetical protein n=1 Tax=Streptomyces sp. NPDC059467 TaxID=3346844 RepID=UPI00369C7B73